MGVKKVAKSKLSASGRWMRENPSKWRQEASRNKPISARKKKLKVESQRERRKAHSQGKDIKNKDWNHVTKRFESVKANRGYPGEGGRKQNVKKNFAMKPGSKNVDSPTTFRKDSPLKDLGFGDTATASMQAYSNPTVNQGVSIKNPPY